MSQLRQPIAVFDSGVGGISVLKQLRRLLPAENYLYLGDSAQAPYGEKSAEEVRRLCFEHTEMLVGRGVKALVLACNTATSVASAPLRAAFPQLPIIGIEPALKPAAAFVASRSDRDTVLVMATPMTIREEKFRALREKWSGGVRVLDLPCAGLAELIERGVTCGQTLDAYLQELFASVARERVAAVVLGCTHYPHIRAAIEACFPPQVGIFDGGEGTARETRRRLAALGLLNPGPEQGQVEIINSRNRELVQVCYKLLED